MSSARVIIDGYYLTPAERKFIAACVMDFIAHHTDVEKLGFEMSVVFAAVEQVALSTDVTLQDAIRLITPLMREIMQEPIEVKLEENQDND